MEAVDVQNLSFSYAGSTKKALDQVSFGLHASEFCVLMGKSGCGKSTLLRHLKRNKIPAGERSGRILCFGREPENMDLRESASRIGFVGQDPDNQIVTDFVWHELAFGLESLGMSNGEMKRRVAEMASFFGIQSWYEQEVRTLSGGQKQLLNLASVMVMQPELLLLDEPTAQLDPIAASDFLHTLEKINRELGTTILISEHRLEELFSMADRILYMEDGTIRMQDTPRKIAEYLTKGTGQASEMVCGLPAAARVYAAIGDCTAGGNNAASVDYADSVDHAAGRREECPLSVREGRLWLKTLLQDRGKEMSLSGAAKEASGRKAEAQKGKKTADRKPALSMDQVWLRYEKNGADILKGVSLQVEKGEWVCLLGGNGAGKSTALKALCGAQMPYRGRMTVYGIPVEKKNMSRLFDRCLSMLPQNPQAIITEITVEEELLEALYGQKITDQEKITRIEEMLQEMKLGKLRKMHPYDLSGGELQRLALGKILLTNPKVLLLDEPTKGLDPFFKRRLAAILRKRKEEGLTILMVSHDIEFCGEYADRCGLFFQGELVGLDTPGRFFSGNSFYTTAANRMARDWFPDAITAKEVAERCKDRLNRRE